MQLANIIEEVTRFQHPKYTIAFDASVSAQTSIFDIKHMCPAPLQVLAYLDRALESSSSFDEDQQYSRSLMVEPRVTTD